MNTVTLAILGMLGGYEVLGILAIVLVLFGAKKVPELAKGLGTGIKEFKKATSDVTSDLQRAIEDDYEAPAESRHSTRSRSHKAAHASHDEDEAGHSSEQANAAAAKRSDAERHDSTA